MVKRKILWRPQVAQVVDGELKIIVGELVETHAQALQEAQMMNVEGVLWCSVTRIQIENQSDP